MTYQEGSRRYLEGLRSDYKEKLTMGFWSDFHSWINEELIRIENHLHILKEQELCLQFQLQGTSPFTFPRTN